MLLQAEQGQSALFRALFSRYQKRLSGPLLDRIDKKRRWRLSPADVRHEPSEMPG